MSRPVALIVNPVATKASRALRAEALRALAPHGLEWSLVTEGPGDAARLAAPAADEGAAVVVTLGGDGTVAEAAGACRAALSRWCPCRAGTPTSSPARPAGRRNRAGDPPAGPALAAADAAGGRAGAARDRRARPGVHDQLRLGPGRGHRRVDRGPPAHEAPPARPASPSGRPWPRSPLVAPPALGRGRRGGGPEAVDVLVACGTPYTYLGPAFAGPGARRLFRRALAWMGLTRGRLHELGRLMARAGRARDPPVGGAALVGGRRRALVVRSASPRRCRPTARRSAATARCASPRDRCSG